jgi:CheY-like chemotaxis protein
MLKRSDQFEARGRVMRVTAAMPGGTWVGGLARERGLTLAGLGTAGARVALEQLAGQTAAQLGHHLPSLLEHLQADRLPLVTSLIDGLVGLVTVLGALGNSGPAHTAVLLVLPVGGPVWAGLVPVGTTYRGVCRASSLLVRIVRTPAGNHVVRASTCNAGHVALSVLIVDDSRPYLEVARRLLERQGLAVVGTASTVAEAVDRVAALHPQVALVDINLVGESGFEVARRLVGEPGGPRVILTSTHAEGEYADLIAESPAVGFVAKERLSADAIRTILAHADA